MRFRLLVATVACVSLGVYGVGYGQVPPSPGSQYLGKTGPNGFVCVAGGGAVDQWNGPTPFWAQTQLSPTGWNITYSQTFYSLPWFMQHFSQWHECGHATLSTPNEFVANCFALERILSEGAMPGDILQIRQVHYGLGPLGPQYGGSGAAFWQNTFATCPQYAQQP